MRLFSIKKWKTEKLQSGSSRLLILQLSLRCAAACSWPKRASSPCRRAATSSRARCLWGLQDLAAPCPEQGGQARAAARALGQRPSEPPCLGRPRRVHVPYLNVITYAGRSLQGSNLLLPCRQRCPHGAEPWDPHPTPAGWVLLLVPALQPAMSHPQSSAFLVPRAFL